MILKGELEPKADKKPDGKTTRRPTEGAPPPDYHTSLAEALSDRSEPELSLPAFDIRHVGEPEPETVHAEPSPLRTPSPPRTPGARIWDKYVDVRRPMSISDEKALPSPPQEHAPQPGVIYPVASSSRSREDSARSSSEPKPQATVYPGFLGVPNPSHVMQTSRSASNLRALPLGAGQPRHPGGPAHRLGPSRSSVNLQYSPLPRSASSSPLPSPLPSALLSPPLSSTSPAAASTLSLSNTLDFSTFSWGNIVSECNRFLSTKRAQKARTAHVRASITELLRSLLSSPSTAVDTPLVLRACEGLATEAGLHLPALLRERLVEGHTPLYWAVLKFARAPHDGSGAPGPSALLAGLAAHARPLAGDALEDARGACISAADNAIFQVLRTVPGLSERSGAEKMLFGEDALAEPGDQIQVTGEDASAAESFECWLEIPQFLQRLRACESIECEFIARGRLFVLTFQSGHPKKPGSDGSVTLGMRAPSPPTYSHSRLLVIPPAGGPPAHVFKFKTMGKRLGPPGAKGVVNKLSTKLDGGLLAGNGALLGAHANGTLRLKLEGNLVKPSSKFQQFMNKSEDASDAGSAVS